MKPELPPITGHSGQLQEVVVNMIQNAIDAMDAVDDGSRVLTVRTERNGNDAISIEIEDSGPGIDPKKSSDDLFDAFFTTKPHGMGLGLAICRMIVEHHGGELSVSSADPHGAIFRIKLPQMKQPQLDGNGGYGSLAISCPAPNSKGACQYRRKHPVGTAG